MCNEELSVQSCAFCLCSSLTPSVLEYSFTFLFLKKWSNERKTGFSKFSSPVLISKVRSLQKKSSLLAINCSKLFKILVYPNYTIISLIMKKKFKKAIGFMFNISITMSIIFSVFLICRLMMKKCMEANISGLFQAGMKTFGGNPGLIPHSVSAKIFLQPWKVILEWILSLSAQKQIRQYQEGLVFFLHLFYYTISLLTGVLAQESTKEGGEAKGFFYQEPWQSSQLVSPLSTGLQIKNI